MVISLNFMFMLAASGAGCTTCWSGTLSKFICDSEFVIGSAAGATTLISGGNTSLGIPGLAATGGAGTAVITTMLGTSTCSRITATLFGSTIVCSRLSGIVGTETIG